MSTTVQLEPREVVVDVAMAATLEVTCGSDPSQIGPAMETSFRRLEEYVREHRLQMVAPPRCIYTGWTQDTVSFFVAMPIIAVTADTHAVGDVHIRDLPGGHAWRFSHRGPYNRIGETYEAVTAWMKEHGHLRTEADWAHFSPMWEEYVGDPRNTLPEELLTYIYVPHR